jgi:hypothetical protein
MGLGLGCRNSYSCFDNPIQKKVKGNPDPNNYEILEIIVTDNGYKIIKVKYPDCNNYEGVKILLFDKTATVEKLWGQKIIDPHFSDNKNYISPIARFEPTERGIFMAKKLCENL